MKRKKTKKGIIIVLSAPSGCGKTTIAKKLLQTIPKLKRSVSATTRPKRKGEREGKDYFFQPERKFLDQRKKGCFLEWAQVFDKFYGTPKTFVEKTVRKGDDVLLTIDVQGAKKIKKKLNDAVYIFLLPPSMTVLRKRLQGRKTDSHAEIKKRLCVARKELQEAKYYDYVVTNDQIQETVKIILSIIQAEKQRINRNKEVLRGIYST
jgi:guanylate kinase